MRWRVCAALIALLTLLAGCRSQPDRREDSYVLEEVAFVDDKAASLAVEGECRLLPLIETPLIENGAKLGITVVKPPAEGGGSATQNKLTVYITQVVPYVFGLRGGGSRVYATLHVEDAKGAREREVVSTAGLGVNPFANLTVCDRLGRTTSDLGLKMMRWLQQTR